MIMEKLVLVQSSMRNSDPKHQIADDFKDLLREANREQWDIIAISESIKHRAVYDLAWCLAQKYGWWFQEEAEGDARFMVHPKHNLLESGYTKVLRAHGGMAKGNYPERGIAEVTIETPKGNIVTDHTTHWNTAFKLGPGGNPEREQGSETITDAMIERVQLHGRGKRISFWQGDTNIDEPKDTGRDHHAIHHKFRKAGLRSVYDELGVFPDTHGNKTIDIIGSYDPDRRVVAQKVDVLPRRGRKADHLIVAATYHIKG